MVWLQWIKSILHHFLENPVRSTTTQSQLTDTSNKDFPMKGRIKDHKCGVNGSSMYT